MGTGIPQGWQSSESSYPIYDPVFSEVGVAYVVEVRISVVVLTYNGAKFLREQLDSILSQISSQDELIISDDGSEDGTCQILKEYQQRYDYIRLLEGPRRGIKKNMEFALEHCRGGIIFLADQDDVWRQDKVVKVMKAFEDGSVTLLVHDAVVFEKDRSQPVMDSFFQFRSSGPGVFKNVKKNSYIGCCMAFRRELLKIALPIPPDIEMHDQWLGVLNDYFFLPSCFLKEPLLFYRRHGENNSGMTHYGLGRMIRNRLVFLRRFLGRIFRRK
ncbi:MAG: glycosyltransferase [Lachnospiraceae bacterium]|nr:glycosyltransferase [Lachnospiraceae bacterium]